MKRQFAAAVAIAFFLLVMALHTNSSTAQVTPLATPAAHSSVSPLGTPLPHWEPSYNPHPRKIKPRAVPFVDGSGEIITKQIVIEREDFDPVVINFKARPQAQVVAVSPLTSELPLFDLTYKTYLPLVKRSPNAQILVIAYMPISYGNPTSPTIESRKLITDLASATSWHNVSPPAIQFEMIGDEAEVVDAYPPTNSNGSWNLWAIYDQFDICDRVWTEGIDEVWIWVDGDNSHPGYGGEWQANGPVWSNGPTDWPPHENTVPPNCGKQMFTMGFNYFRGGGLESYAHSVEISLLTYELAGIQACDFLKSGLYGLWHTDGWGQQECGSVGGYSADSGFTSLSHVDIYGNHKPGVCGDAHYPPNIIAERAVGQPFEYDYDNTDTIESRCMDWQWNILTNTVPISCGVWGCNQDRYHIWWMQQVPGLNNNSHGRTGTLRPNWWNYRLTP